MSSGRCDLPSPTPRPHDVPPTTGTHGATAGGAVVASSVLIFFAVVGTVVVVALLFRFKSLPNASNAATSAGNSFAPSANSGDLGELRENQCHGAIAAIRGSCFIHVM